MDFSLLVSAETPNLPDMLSVLLENDYYLEKTIPLGKFRVETEN